MLCYAMLCCVMLCCVVLCYEARPFMYYRYEDDDNNDSNVSVPNDMHLQLASLALQSKQYLLCNRQAKIVKKISLIL